MITKEVGKVVSQKDESEAKRFVDDLIASLEEIEEGTIVRGSGETGRRNQESDEEGPTEGGFWEEIEAELDIAKRMVKIYPFIRELGQSKSRSIRGISH